MLCFNIDHFSCFAFPETKASGLFYTYLLTITCSRIANKYDEDAFGGKRFELASTA